MINELLAIGAWPFLGGIAIAFFIGLVTTPGRIGRIACHWGLHDMKESRRNEQSSFGGCTRCPKVYQLDI